MKPVVVKIPVPTMLATTIEEAGMSDRTRRADCESDSSPAGVEVVAWNGERMRTISVKTTGLSLLGGVRSAIRGLILTLCAFELKRAASCGASVAHNLSALGVLAVRF